MPFDKTNLQCFMNVMFSKLFQSLLKLHILWGEEYQSKTFRIRRCIIPTISFIWVGQTNRPSIPSSSLTQSHFELNKAGVSNYTLAKYCNLLSWQKMQISTAVESGAYTPILHIQVHSNCNFPISKYTEKYKGKYIHSI